MAIIQCPECGREMSDKAEKCIHCGCPLDGAVQNADVTAPKTKNSKGKTGGVLGAFVVFFLIMGLFIFAFVALINNSSSNRSSSNSSGNSDSAVPDPDRTWESCSLYGETRVFGSVHTDRTYCLSDGDGYYNPVFGHHHHK